MTPGWWEGLVLGLVQGLTEFLPVSSSGHLVLAQEIVGFRPPGLYFEVALHVATLLSVLIAYRPQVMQLLVGLLRREREAIRYTGLLALASVPAAIAGIGFRDFFAASFESGVALGVQFLLTAAMLAATRRVMPRATRDHITARDALAMGVAQAFAILPAISRSGATIAAGLGLGVAPARAAEFSFLMSIVAVAGSGLLEARHLPPDADFLTIGFVGAFVAALVSGVWAIRFLVALLRSNRFHAFAWYCAAVGILTIVYYTARG